jgi:hypothetical protein
MKINEVTIYRLDATNTELDIRIYEKYDTSPINGNWYATNHCTTGDRAYPLDTYNHAPTYDSLSKILEKNFQDMMPFKGQLELF